MSISALSTRREIFSKKIIAALQGLQQAKVCGVAEAGPRVVILVWTMQVQKIHGGRTLALVLIRPYCVRPV